MKASSKRILQAHLRTSLLGAGVAATVLGLTSVNNANAQFDSAFPVRTYPTLPYTTPENKDYNLKLGALTIALGAEVHVEWTDNVRLDETDEQDDIYIEPRVRFGFLYAPARNHSLNFDVSVGYRLYVDNSELNTLNITPNSSLEYRVLAQDFQFRIYDRFGVDLDATSTAELSGEDADPNEKDGALAFQRFSNTIGLDTTWNPTSDFAATVGYSYYINRSISGTFEQLDRDDHQISGNTTYEINNQWGTGLHASYTIVDYLNNNDPAGQNDGAYYTVGPLLTFRPTQKITISGSVGYTSSNFESNGNNGDTDDFSGLTWQLGARQQLTRNTSHDFRVGSSAEPGVNSNFSEILRFQYGLSTEISRGVVLSLGLGYDQLSASGDASSNNGVTRGQGEESDRFLGTIGTSFQLSRKLKTTLAYTIATKDSNLAGRDYLQNRVTGVIIYTF